MALIGNVIIALSLEYMNKRIGNTLTRNWTRLIAFVLWSIEKRTFYPKLKSFYQAKVMGAPIIFDVGANRGQSIQFFQSVFSNPTIHAFEPSPRLLNQLNRHVNQHVTIHNVGLSSEVGILTFYDSILDEVSTFERPDTTSKYLKFKSRVLLTSAENLYTQIPVTVTKLDLIASELGIDNIDICKIDVEGHELEVLRGATNTLKNHVIRYLQIEIHFDDQYSASSESVEDFLAHYGYKKVTAFKHSFGNFQDVIFTHE